MRIHRAARFKLQQLGFELRRMIKNECHGSRAHVGTQFRDKRVWTGQCQRLPSSRERGYCFGFVRFGILGRGVVALMGPMLGTCLTYFCDGWGEVAHRWSTWVALRPFKCKERPAAPHSAQWLLRVRAQPTLPERSEPIGPCCS